MVASGYHRPIEPGDHRMVTFPRDRGTPSVAPAPVGGSEMETETIMATAPTRRDLAVLAAALLIGATTPGPADAATPAAGSLAEALAAIEASVKGRLGVAIVDTASGRRWDRRADERFPMCSTFKVLAVGAVLALVDAGVENLDRRVRFEAGDVVAYSPRTKDRVGGAGMTLAELCEAALTLSDNTAGNLILKAIGGPAAVTAFAVALGDATTRLDRWETELNEAKPGDPRDTTTPAAMAGLLRRLLLEDGLSPASRERLTAWMLANRTGDAKLRAGLTPGWRVADKTGGGDFGSTNDVAVIWPPAGAPVIVTVYLTETGASFDERNAAIAAVAAAIRAELTV